MDLEELKRESTRLSRSATKLVVAEGGTDGRWNSGCTEGIRIAAFTQSQRIVVLETVDGRWRAREETHMPTAGSPLAAIPWCCPAPIEAVFLRGGDRVGDWLSACGWQRSWGYNDNFSQSALVREFEGWWQEQHPLYTGDAVAVAGGWHFGWPDDDWSEWVDEELVLWTVDSEPYLEVWSTGRVLAVRQRVT